MVKSKSSRKSVSKQFRVNKGISIVSVMVVALVSSYLVYNSFASTVRYYRMTVGQVKVAVNDINKGAYFNTKFKPDSTFATSIGNNNYSVLTYHIENTESTVTPIFSNNLATNNDAYLQGTYDACLRTYVITDTATITTEVLRSNSSNSYQGLLPKPEVTTLRKHTSGASQEVVCYRVANPKAFTFRIKVEGIVELTSLSFKHIDTQ